jgi:dihydropteroate synthase
MTPGVDSPDGRLPPFQIGSRTFDFARTYVMGILNVTPDSFFDGGAHFEKDRAVEQVERMLAEGADIIDVGGESTRPGSQPVGPEEEKRRVVPIIETIRECSDVPISVDTTKAEVALAAVQAGADLINDISGMRFEPRLARIAADHGLPMVLMHSRHTPETMQRSVHYDDLRAEIVAELEAGIRKASAYGVPRERIIVDPGIGFGKTPGHNLEILATPGFLDELMCPVLVGPSNKSFIAAVTDAPVDQRTGGTAAAVTAAVMGGAHFVRVHDVATMVQVTRVAHAMSRACHGGGETWIG